VDGLHEDIMGMLAGCNGFFLERHGVLGSWFRASPVHKMTGVGEEH
jgi:hypothetical protein